MSLERRRDGSQRQPTVLRTLLGFPLTGRGCCCGVLTVWLRMMRRVGASQHMCELLGAGRQPATNSESNQHDGNVDGETMRRARLCDVIFFSTLFLGLVDF